ncbi:MAG: hypothetical protein AAF197_12455, partial [Pseudomonadota bacterium]
KSAQQAVANVNRKTDLQSVLADRQGDVAGEHTDHVGVPIVAQEEYWLEDNEIIAEKHSVLSIKAERRMVYSVIEPGRWPLALRGKSLSKVPLSKNWRPKSSMKAYPLDRLIWINDLITLNNKLEEGLDPDNAYAIFRWPPFDLLELDNHLLRLSTLMLIRGGTIADLATRVGCDQSLVCGFINACHRAGYLRSRSDLAPERFIETQDDGVLGMIKDAFR